MSGIPPALETDTEDVTWALQTAEALWKRNERSDALVWLRRAAQAAGEVEQDDRALELAHDAAELAEWLSHQPKLAPAARSTPFPSTPGAFPLERIAHQARPTETDEVEDISVDVDVESAPGLLRERLDTPTSPDELREAPFPSPEVVQRPLPVPLPPPPRAARVPSAAEKHAGMLDPWAEGDARPPSAAPWRESSGKLPAAASSTNNGSSAEEVVTSAPVIGAQETRRPEAIPTAPAPANFRPDGGTLDLSQVNALSDLPDDARDAFAAAAEVRDLWQNEEISGFALALILEGSVDVAATIVDTPADRLESGAVIRARGTIEPVSPVRLVAATETARVATWNEPSVAEAFRTCPWVEDDLREAGDRVHALVGVTMGPLGERLDPTLRAQVASRLTLRALTEHEVFAARGKPIPGLLVVGAGELELVDDAGAPRGTVIRAGDFLFPHEVLSAGPAPSTVRAAKGGALVLFADRHVAQELLVTCPPLLEIFAGM